MIVYELDPKLLVGKRGPVSGPHVVKVSTFDDAGVESFCAKLAEAIGADQGIVPVEIDSDGGSLDALFRMQDELDVARRRGMRVATIVKGRACSAAADLLASGDLGLRFVAPTARVMIHYGNEEVTTRNVPDVVAAAEEVRRQYDLSFEIFDRNCGQPRGYFQKLLRDVDQVDLYVTPERAVELGIADAVGIPELLVKVDVSIDIRLPTNEFVHKGAAKRRKR